MNILVVSQYFWPENFKINDFVEWMLKRKHSVTVLTGIPNYPEGKFFPGYGLFKNRRQKFRGADIIRSPLIPRGKSRGWNLVLNYFSFVFSASITGLLNVKKKYDVIFVFASSPVTAAIPAIIFKKIFRMPLCLWVLDLWPESVFSASRLRSAFIYRWLVKMVRFIYRHCDRIFISSKSFRSSINKKGVEDARIEYLPNWAEDLYLRSGNRNEGNNMPALPEGFRIMFAGNIGEAQDFDSVLKAAELLKDYKDIKWIIVGDGRKKNWVEKQLIEKGLDQNIFLLGRFPMDKMPAFYSFADAMLVSLKSSEIFSLTVPAKVQSYMASGKPILTMLDGEGSAIVDEAAAGLSCGAGDYGALAANVLRLYKMDRREIQVMAANGLDYYKAHFDKHLLLSRVERIFESLSAGNKAEEGTGN
ncbi:MAG: glycosyltransferase family 4 protein [Spirochaetales bacterium]|nr:glycosyltransferase family 4 protein [Spirochaetales bacterium]